MSDMDEAGLIVKYLEDNSDYYQYFVVENKLTGKMQININRIDFAGIVVLEEDGEINASLTYVNQGTITNESTEEYTIDSEELCDELERIKNNLNAPITIH